MITENICVFFIDLCSSILSGFPAIALPATLINSVTHVLVLLVETRFWIPWSIIFVCIGWLVFIYTASFTMSVMNWLFRKIPTIS